MTKHKTEHLGFPFDAVSFLSKITRSKILIQAILVGILVGLIVVSFKVSIETIEEIIHKFAGKQSSGLYILALPLIGALGGLISGLLVYKIKPEASGSGIPFIKLTLARIGKGVTFRSSVVKFFSGIIGIGTGLSLGKEGPSIHIGAGAGTVISKIFNVKGTDKDKLIAAGAGSAIGAIFNAPIAGAMFVIEELTHTFSSALLFPVLIATIVASEIGRYLLGNNPAFLIPIHNNPINLETIPAFLILGVITGILGVLFSKNLLFNLEFFKKHKNIKPWYKTAIAGFVAGTFIIFLPEITGSGNSYIEALLHGEYVFSVVVLILIGKFLLTSFCYGSGAAGGIFMPIMMLGAFTGYATGIVMNTYFNMNIEPSLMALMGMGGFFSAVIRTPITSIIIVFEMTGNYQNILPIMLCAAIADLIAEKLGSHPIYSSLIFKQQPDNKKASILTTLKIKDHMSTNIEKLKKDDSLEQCLNMIKHTLHCGFPIVSENNELMGIITKADIEDVSVQGLSCDKKITDIMNTNPYSIHENETMYNALLDLHLNTTAWLIVVDDDHKVKGIITRFDIKNAATGFKKDLPVPEISY